MSFWVLKRHWFYGGFFFWFWLAARFGLAAGRVIGLLTMIGLLLAASTVQLDKSWKLLPQ
jgi:hypothetical protein